jgi:hypothetical protein
MLLLYDAFIYHNAQAAPAPWAGMHLSIKEQNLFQQNQIGLVKFCLHQNENQAWKLFGKGSTKRTTFEIVLFILNTLFFMCKKGP